MKEEEKINGTPRFWRPDPQSRWPPRGISGWRQPRSQSGNGHRSSSGISQSWDPTPSCSCHPQPRWWICQRDETPLHAPNYHGRSTIVEFLVFGVRRKGKIEEEQKKKKKGKESGDRYKGVDALTSDGIPELHRSVSWSRKNVSSLNILSSWSLGVRSSNQFLDCLKGSNRRIGHAFNHMIMAPELHFTFTSSEVPQSQGLINLIYIYNDGRHSGEKGEGKVEGGDN